MSGISIHHVFTMPRQQVVEHLSAMIDDMAKRYDLKTAWSGQDDVSFKRSGVDGKINIAENDLHIVIKLGFMVSMFQQTIENDIHAFLAEHIQ